MVSNLVQVDLKYLIATSDLFILEKNRQIGLVQLDQNCIITTRY